MYISWLGLSCFKIQTKEATLVIDPYRAEVGLKPPRLKADIVILSGGKYLDPSRVRSEEEQVFLIDAPGEYEIKNIFIYSIPVVDKENTSLIFSIEIAGITIVHLGRINRVLKEEELEKVEEADILMIPVGGREVLDAKEATRVISQIKPKLIIPMYYRIPGISLALDSLGKFCQEMGLGRPEKMEKLKLSQKELPDGEMKVVVLESKPC